MTVYHLNGRRVNWNDPPPANAMMRWHKRTMYGGLVRGSLRHIAHLDRLNNLAKSRFNSELVIIQSAYNTTVSASAGTHDFDAVVDCYIPGVSWWTQQRFLRTHGLGCWYRHPPTFGNHIHGFTLPPREGRSVADDFAVHGFKVGVYVPGQLVDYYNHAFGLARAHTPGSDRSWFPSNISSTIFNLDRYIDQRREKDWLEMASEAQVKQMLREVLRENLVPVPNNENDNFYDIKGKVSLIGAVQAAWREARAANVKAYEIRQMSRNQ